MFANIPSIPWGTSKTGIFYAGDSLAEQCRKDFGMPERAFGFVGWPGASSSEMRARLSSMDEGWPYKTEPTNFEERVKFHEAGTIVLSLGTNDCWKGTTDVEWNSNIDWFMSVADGRPVCWFDIKQSTDWVPRSDQLSWYLYAATERYPNLKIIPWKEWCEENPSALLTDGVHIATYEFGCVQGRNKLMRLAVPDANITWGYWYPHTSLPGQSIHLTGWGAAMPKRTDEQFVNLRVDWKHVNRWPVNQTTEDVYARAASGRGWEIWLGPEWKGKWAAVDLLDPKTGLMTPLGERRL
jgi:hypothetical protein